MILACECDSHGSNGISCDEKGNCECLSNFDGSKCDRCREDYYNFPICEGNNGVLFSVPHHWYLYK